MLYMLPIPFCANPLVMSTLPMAEDTVASGLGINTDIEYSGSIEKVYIFISDSLQK